MLQTAQNELVPLSHLYTRGTAGQTERRGTRSGTAAGQQSLKALAYALLRCPASAGQVGQQRDNGGKVCPTSYTQAGQKSRGEMDAGQERKARGDTHTFCAPAPLPMDWTPDIWDGRPCCFLPHVPARLRGVLPLDLRGLGVPKEGLPPFLRGCSACGWTLELVAGRLELKQSRPDARNEDGCRGYLKANAAAVAADLRRWEEAAQEAT